MCKSMLRRVPLEGAFNFRDLGGYPVAGGLSTRYGVFYRSGCINDLTTSDKEKIKKLGVKTVIDLRGEHELQSRPGAFTGDADVRVINIDLLSKLDPNSVYKHTTDDPNFIPDLYITMIDSCGEKIGQFIKAAAENAQRGAVLYHCSAGKDRTGMISMFLLGLAGVERMDIVADYQVSETYIEHAFPGAKHALTSSPLHIQRALKYLEDEYGGIERYARTHGIVSSDINALRAIFLGNE
ncbi:MAG: tyrosine-protein phosphatase [Christensenellales bacterium]|jgi:protein-tyrosine phosphatase